jgi:hypothetical protein
MRTECEGIERETGSPSRGVDHCEACPTNYSAEQSGHAAILALNGLIDFYENFVGYDKTGDAHDREAYKGIMGLRAALKALKCEYEGGTE